MLFRVLTLGPLLNNMYWSRAAISGNAYKAFNTNLLFGVAECKVILLVSESIPASRLTGGILEYRDPERSQAYKCQSFCFLKL